jgi:hypothetical protein
MQYGTLRIISSYDYTSSSVGAEMKGNGAFEISIIQHGGFGEHQRAAKNMNCPLFY